ncbi:MAG: hypothetical protein WAT70_04010, partial [Rhizobiaceae bacterium]
MIHAPSQRIETHMFSKSAASRFTAGAGLSARSESSTRLPAKECRDLELVFLARRTGGRRGTSLFVKLAATRRIKARV